ncbi:3'-5' exonuclease-like [Primulina huaijiensis]|uniref:3'-5' exonuclease-like n=1 Tax=Primulina huaijiensis TaxID=1492673 RepID=UPI003CC72E1E
MHISKSFLIKKSSVFLQRRIDQETMAMTLSIIDHQLPYDTHNTYEVLFYDYSIHTTVTHDPATVSRWISEVESIHRSRLHHLIVGLDVEWRPSYSRYNNNPVATLQLCVGRRCLVYQLIHSPGVPSSLTGFLSNPNYTFVGIGIKADLEKLEEDYEFGYSANSVDLRDLAANAYGRSELRNSGVKTLAEIVLEKEVKKPKSVTMSRWDNPWLTPAQVQYACVDAFVCFEIGRILNASG